MTPSTDDEIERVIRWNERNSQEMEQARQLQAQLATWPNERLILMALGEILANTCHVMSPESTALIRELWRRSGGQP